MIPYLLAYYLIVGVYFAIVGLIVEKPWQQSRLWPFEALFIALAWPWVVVRAAKEGT